MKSLSSTKHVTTAACILATMMTFSVLGCASAQEETTPSPQQGMGPNQQQMMQGMMQQMQNCMGQMDNMQETAPQEMRARMKTHMQSCMQQMQMEENNKD